MGHQISKYKSPNTQVNPSPNPNIRNVSKNLFKHFPKESFEQIQFITLLECGQIDLDVIDKKEGAKVLLRASEVCVTGGLISKLLEIGVDINTTDDNGETPLYKAVSWQNLDVVRILLEKGADVNGRYNKGETLLFSAVRNGNLKLLKLLIEAGCDVNAKTDKGETILHSAIAYGRSEVVKLLLEKGAGVKAVNEYGLTPLQSALEFINLDLKSRPISIPIIKMLVENGADILATNKHRAAAVDMVSNHPELMEILVNGALLNENKKNGEKTLSIFFQAVEKGNLELVKMMLERGVDINANDPHGNSALCIAVIEKNAKMVRFLLEKGADGNVTAPPISTHLRLPLFEFAKKWPFKDKEIAKALREKPSKELLTLINSMKSMEKNSNNQEDDLLSKIDQLINDGANYKENDERGYNALHCAIEKGNLAVVKKLIDRFPHSINDPIKLNQNAKNNPKDYYSYFFTTGEMTPYDLAKSLGHSEIEKLLYIRGGYCVLNQNGKDDQKLMDFENGIKSRNDSYLQNSNRNDSDLVPAKVAEAHNKLLTETTENSSEKNTVKNTIIGRLYEAFKISIKSKPKSKLNIFVNPRVGFEPEAEQSWDAEKSVSNFINNPQQKTLLLLGGPFSGKSLLSEVTAKKLWNEFKTSSSIEKKMLPIWIDVGKLLELMNQNNISLLEAYFKNMQFSEKSVGDFYRYCEEHNCSLILFLDGLDEVSPVEKNLILKNLSDFQGKVIITSRTDYFVNNLHDVDWKSLAKLVNHDPDQLLILNLQNFSKEEISIYLQKYAQQTHLENSPHSEVDWKIYQNYMDQIRLDKSNKYALQFVKYPFLLGCAVDILSKMQLGSATPSSKEIENIRKTILDKLIDNWIEEQSRKLVQEKTNVKQILLCAKFAKIIDQGDEVIFLKNILRKYITNLALFFIKKGKGSLEYTLSIEDTLNPLLLTPNSNERPLLQNEGIPQSFMETLRSCALLQPFKNGFRFIDPLLPAHIANYHLVDKIVDTKERSAFPIPKDHTSNISSDKKQRLMISYDVWGVSILRNPLCNAPNHVFLLLEGMNCWGQRILHRYDFMFCLDPKTRELLTDRGHVEVSEKIVCSFGEYEDKLKKILGCNPSDVRVFQPPICINRNLAKKLHHSILNDKNKIYEFDQLGWGQKYNCLKWAYDKLKFLGDPKIDEALAKLGDGLFKFLPIASMKYNPEMKIDKTTEEFDRALPVVGKGVRFVCGL